MYLAITKVCRKAYQPCSVSLCIIKISLFALTTHVHITAHGNTVIRSTVHNDVCIYIVSMMQPLKHTTVVK